MMAIEKFLNSKNNKCADCIHIDACARIADVLDFPFETIVMYSGSCTAYEQETDAAPTRHGYWDWDGKHFYCSVCSGTRYHYLVLWLDAAYCPYCGAQMEV